MYTFLWLCDVVVIWCIMFGGCDVVNIYVILVYICVVLVSSKYACTPLYLATNVRILIILNLVYIFLDIKTFK